MNAKDKQNRNRPTHVSSIYFDKGAKAFEWRKKNLFPVNSPGKKNVIHIENK